MKEIVRGIIVGARGYNESDLLLSILLEDSRYIRGYLSQIRRDNLKKNSNCHCAIGQQVVLIIQEKNQNFPHFYLDSIENSLIYLFFGHPEKLEILNEIFKLTNRLPQNIEHKNLYENFLETLKLLSSDPSKSLNFWKNHIEKILS